MHQVRKRLRADFTKTVAWEHFMELKDTAPEGSVERSRIVWGVLRAAGVEEMPSILQYSMIHNVDNDDCEDNDNCEDV